MQLTLYTDYTLRVLLYLALHPEKRCTITEISTAYGISRNHLVKVVHKLGQGEWISTTRGKNGGMQLARPPKEINIGQLVRETEPHMNILECFDKETNTCPIIAPCSLKHVLFQARKAFMDVLDRHTLADALNQPEQIIQILHSSTQK
ncbi:MAG: Rrf2 family transcriptional regulator [Zetaproteobacteria bacterium]|nr:Rrf2 family transcriptional regulator [Zetaproteobacteria bacterium]